MERGGKRGVVDPSKQMQILFLCLASIAVFVRAVNPLQINAKIRKTSGRSEDPE